MEDTKAMHSRGNDNFAERTQLKENWENFKTEHLGYDGIDQYLQLNLFT